MNMIRFALEEEKPALELTPDMIQAVRADSAVSHKDLLDELWDKYTQAIKNLPRTIHETFPDFETWFQENKYNLVNWFNEHLQTPRVQDPFQKTISEAGVDPETADERAKLAQEYGGENLDQILLGAGLGGLAAGTGLEKVLASRILKNAGIVPKSIKTAAFAGVKEAAPEFIQAAQEQIAGNVALQREGFEDIPTLRGVASAAALEGSIGFLLGAGVDVAMPAQQQAEYDAARANITNEVDREREAALRAEETRRAQEFIAALNAENKRRQQGQADQVNIDAEAAAARTRAADIAAPNQDEVNELAAPMRGVDVSNDVQFGVAYGQKIARTLGDYFPNFGQFSVTQGDTVLDEAGEPQPTFTIIDSEGKRYGQPLTTFGQANATAYSLNKEVLNQNVRGAILNSLETSSQAYDPETTQRLFSYGYRTLNPVDRLASLRVSPRLKRSTKPVLRKARLRAASLVWKKPVPTWGTTSPG